MWGTQSKTRIGMVYRQSKVTIIARGAMNTMYHIAARRVGGVCPFHLRFAVDCVYYMLLLKHKIIFRLYHAEDRSVNTQQLHDDEPYIMLIDVDGNYV